MAHLALRWNFTLAHCICMGLHDLGCSCIKQGIYPLASCCRSCHLWILTFSTNLCYDEVSVSNRDSKIIKIFWNQQEEQECPFPWPAKWMIYVHVNYLHCVVSTTHTILQPFSIFKCTLLIQPFQQSAPCMRSETRHTFHEPGQSS
jgi:hypothetical protein